MLLCLTLNPLRFSNGNILCSWIERINIIKMSSPPQAIYRFNTIAIKILMTYFTDIEQIFQNFI